MINCHLCVWVIHLKIYTHTTRSHVFSLQIWSLLDVYLISKSQSKLSILIGVIWSATSKCPTTRAKNTICCSSVNLMFSACVKSYLISTNVSLININFVLRLNIEIANTLRKPCCSPSYCTRATGKPFFFSAR